MDFEDQVVVITGGVGGIGLATAELALEQGANVVLCDSSEEALAEAVERLSSEGDQVSGYACDVSDRQMVRDVAGKICESLGRIDVLINSAAVQRIAHPRDVTEEHWLREINVVLSGSFYWAQAAADLSMIPRNSGSIVNIGSGASLTAIPDSASYVAAKHGVIGLTKALAIDWAQFGIRVNCVCPGFTWTPLAQQISEARPEVMKERVARIPYGKGATPADIAQSIVFIASDKRSPATSGSTLLADGGTVALSSGYLPPGYQVEE